MPTAGTPCKSSGPAIRSVRRNSGPTGSLLKPGARNSNPDLDTEELMPTRGNTPAHEYDELVIAVTVRAQQLVYQNLIYDRLPPRHLKPASRTTTPGRTRSEASSRRRQLGIPIQIWRPPVPIAGSGLRSLQNGKAPRKGLSTDGTDCGWFGLR